MNAILDADTLLAVDVGSVNTRANLFDVVDGRYRLIATGRSPSTVGTPVYDISEGVRMALDKVQTITGRRLVDESEELIMPVTNEGTGVDVLVATATAGSKVRTILVGLMPGVSLQSIRRLAASSYLEIVGEIGLMDRRREEERIDLIVAARPDLISWLVERMVAPAIRSCNWLRPLVWQRTCCPGESKCGLFSPATVT